MIYAERIRQARMIKGLTQKGLAIQVGVSQVALSKYETNKAIPSPSVALAIAIATGVAPEFFERLPPAPISIGSLAYRARASTKVSRREQAHQFLSFLVEQTRQMSASRRLPELRFPNPLGDPLQSARLTRVAFGIQPHRPVSRLVNVMERHGGVVFGLPLAWEGIDAFSTWATIDVERPVTALALGSAGDRRRYSTAHELGHLVMHKGVRDYPVELEKEADQFAAEFLFPAEAVRKAITKPLTLELAWALKSRWGVSMQMIVRRGRDAGVLSEWHYRGLFQQIGAKGWRTREPVEIAIERPRLYRQLAETIYGQEYEKRMALDYCVGGALAKSLLSQYDASYNAPARQGS